MNRMLSTSSGLKSADAQITTQQSYVMGFDLQPPCTGIITFTVYDSSNSDTTNKLVLAQAEIDAGVASINHEFFAPIIANSGIYCTISGGTSTYQLRYSL